MTEPMSPTAEPKEPIGIVGTKVPSRIARLSGLTTKKFTKKHVAMIAINNAKNPYKSDKYIKIWYVGVRLNVSYFKLPDSKVVNEEEYEGIEDGNDGSCPDWDSKENVQGNGRPNDFLYKNENYKVKNAY